MALPQKYDDGGYTGANMDRPALKRLLADVESGVVNCVVVYKVDRLTRSLLDFSRIIEILDKNSATFVSVTQQFNTTTSLGRLTLNILLSFAQFEREMISERTHDKMAAARRKGKWVGGNPVLGYDVAPQGGSLVVNRGRGAARAGDLCALPRVRLADPGGGRTRPPRLADEGMDHTRRPAGGRKTDRQEHSLQPAHQHDLHRAK